MNGSDSSKVASINRQNTPAPREVRQALDEFEMMLRYSLAEGLDLDETTRDTVATVQQTLIAVRNLPEGAALPEPGMLIFVNQLMAAHSALSRIIAPATPLSLSATEPTERLGYLGNPPLIMWMIFIAIVSAVGFVFTSVVYGTANTGAVGQKLNWCFAAALGAVFYVLFTALDYVKDRTFDPRYNSIYVIRFVLGVLAGLILAIILGAPLFKNNTTISSLGPAVIALVGGFSTEAVYQVLQRFVDLLLTAVRGDDSSAAKAKASDMARKELLKLAEDPEVSDRMKPKLLAAAKKVGA